MDTDQQESLAPQGGQADDAAPTPKRNFSLASVLLATVCIALSFGLLDSQLPVIGASVLVATVFGTFWALVHGRDALIEGLACGLIIGLILGLATGLGDEGHNRFNGMQSYPLESP